MYVQSLYRYDAVATFDPVNGALVEFSRQTASEGAPQGALAGVYAWLSEVPAVFYRVESSLWLLIGNVARNVDTDDVDVKYSHEAGRSTLALTDKGIAVVEVSYEPVFEMYPEDLTPFVERDHFDFGLFIRNVLDDPGRRARIYSGNPPD